MANTLPRPRPPGRVRQHRASLISFEPNSLPPPYAPEDVSETFGNSKDDFDLSAIDETSLGHKSKEELSSMLLWATSSLNARQNELTMAASIGQELVQVNVDLQAKYDSLLTQRTPKRSASTRDTPIGSPEFHCSHPPSFGTDHKIQEAISLLQSQNEMLIAQIHHLEEESTESQRQGKQRIRLLEKEMSLLRSGLELSQQRAHELENQLEEDRGREVRRLVHNKRLSALRQRLDRPDNPFRGRKETLSGDAGSESGSESYSLPPSPAGTSRSELEARSFTPVDTQEAASPTRSNSRLPVPAPDLLAQNLSNQLLQKIVELEAANKDLMASQLEIKTRLESLSNRSHSVDTPFEDAPTHSLVHTRSFSELGTLGGPTANGQLRRRRVESESDMGRPAYLHLSTPGSPIKDDPVEHSLLDELSRVQEDSEILATPVSGSSYLVANLETNDTTVHPIIPGAFSSPARDRSPASASALLDERDERRSEMQVANVRPQRSSLFLEIWVFLQFCVILVVFMFSLGRRSPIQNTK